MPSAICEFHWLAQTALHKVPLYLDASPTVGLVASVSSSIGGAIESALSEISGITRLFGELHHTH